MESRAASREVGKERTNVRGYEGTGSNVEWGMRNRTVAGYNCQGGANRCEGEGSWLLPAVGGMGAIKSVKLEGELDRLSQFLHLRGRKSAKFSDDDGPLDDRDPFRLDH